MSKAKTITAEELDRLVDEGKEDVLQYFDLDNLRSAGSTKIRRTTIDLPEYMFAALDEQAKRIGIARQALIKVWLSEALKKVKAEQSSGSNTLSDAVYSMQARLEQIEEANRKLTEILGAGVKLERSED
jgi:hypothetical protein